VVNNSLPDRIQITPFLQNHVVPTVEPQRIHLIAIDCSIILSRLFRVDSHPTEKNDPGVAQTTLTKESTQLEAANGASMPQRTLCSRFLFR
jgi:hypothetical protein